MEKIHSRDIRNVCLLGHGASGKTSLAEAMLYVEKLTDRLGKTPDGNTVCDYDPEEIKRGFSLQTAIAPVTHKGAKINIIDTPGYLDFVGEAAQALRVAGSALIVVDAKAGVEVGTELAWDMVTKEKMPRAFFINKCDDPDARFKTVSKELHDKFGSSICPVVIPLMTGDKIVGLLDLIQMRAVAFENGKDGQPIEIPEGNDERIATCRNMLHEAVASTSEELMEKFFEGEAITHEEIVKALHDGILRGDITPIICGSATNLCGVRLLLDIIVDTLPSPVYHKAEIVVDAEGEHEVPLREHGPASIFVFKTIADPFVGKMSFFKVMGGELYADSTLKNLTTEQDERLTRIYTVCGKKQTEVKMLSMGDIGMTAKLISTNTNDTLSQAENALPYKKIVYPGSYYQMAIAPKAKGDEDKIAQGIAKLLEEDLTLKYENNAETKQLLLSGQGDIHLDVVVSKLKARFGTSVVLSEPKIAYRETIKKKVEVEGKHKKQSGGHGQYGHVKMTFAPGINPGLEFTTSVVGGSVPKNYFPAVEKGLLEAMQKGVLAGYPMVNLRADLSDGSYHPVDSSEMAFKIAASLAYKEALPKAQPVLLEPIGKLHITAPGDMLGDIMGAINKRRGRVLGMTPAEKHGDQIIEADAPMAELVDFAIQLRAITQGRGSYTLTFWDYEEVPALNAQKIIAEALKQD
ncbi:MAG: elongation factor G [Clostridia bacterium]|nr:elongation factor G [Clostridia bacterium]